MAGCLRTDEKGEKVYRLRRPYSIRGAGVQAKVFLFQVLSWKIIN